MVEDPAESRQATKSGNNRAVLLIGIALVVVVFVIAYFYIMGQDTDEAVDGVVVDPDPAPVTEDQGAATE